MLGTCYARGEIDRATAPILRADLRHTIDRSDTERVVVDCSAVTFADSACYHTLVEATSYARDHGHSLVIRNPSPSCALLLCVCDWDGLCLEDAERWQ